MKKEELIEKIRNSSNLKIYDCGLYAKYEVDIKKKYTKDRTPVKLPDNYLVIVLEKDL